MNIEEFETFTKKAADELEAKRKIIETLSKGDGGMTMGLFTQTLKTFEMSSKSMWVIVKCVPSKKALDAAKNLEKANIEFLLAFADGMIDMVKAKRRRK